MKQYQLPLQVELNWIWPLLLLPTANYAHYMIDNKLKIHWLFIEITVTWYNRKKSKSKIKSKHPFLRSGM